VEPPGRRFAYSNSAFVVLEQLLADVSGTPFGELGRLRFFAPLGMSSSTFAAGPPPPLYDRAVWGHDPQRGPIDSKGLRVPAAVGGLWTTPSDLARLLAAFFASYRGSASSLISQPLARQTMQPQAGGQGLAGPVEGTAQAIRLAQMGVMPGFVAYAVGYPELGRGAVIMINAGGRSGRLALEIARAVAAEYAWPGFVREYQRAAQAADALSAFAGEYQFANPSLPKIRVTQRGDRLFWQELEMVPVVGGTFVLPDAGIEVRFVRDAAGKVVAAEFGEPGMRNARITRSGAAEVDPPSVLRGQ
jgi:CubicO group peptidase (beta-lactamase class C family)